MASRLTQQTLHYKTYVKNTLVGALRAIFADHPDTILRRTNVGIDFPFTKTDYPSIVIRFYERTINNAGVGHIEWFPDEDDLGRYVKYKHYLYQGDIEFAIYALSSIDRDLMADSLIEILAMGELQTYSSILDQRLYRQDFESDPIAIEHYITLNTDQISGFGETQVIAPWMPEDVMVYQTSYRVNIHGEFYSKIPTPTNFGIIGEVDLFPYSPAAGETEPNPNPEDPAPWV